MKIFDVIKLMFQKKVSDKTSADQVEVPYSPLDIKLGSLVSFLDVDLNLARVNGSVAKFPRGVLPVKMICESTIFGVNVFTYYFGDYCLQAIENNDNIQFKLWCLRDTIWPQTVDDWNEWLGRYTKNDDGSLSLVEYGLIGWPQFQIDDLGLVYQRNWNVSDQPCLPAEYFTSVKTSTDTSYIKSHSMEYKRQLSDDMYEYLFVDASVSMTKSNVSIWIGIDLDSSSITILNS